MILITQTNAPLSTICSEFYLSTVSYTSTVVTDKWPTNINYTWGTINVAPMEYIKRK